MEKEKVISVRSWYLCARAESIYWLEEIFIALPDKFLPGQEADLYDYIVHDHEFKWKWSATSVGSLSRWHAVGWPPKSQRIKLRELVRAAQIDA